MWLRRDLRAKDNHALYRALTHARHVVCVFVFDTDILNALEDKAHRRVEFIRESLAEIQRILRKHGSALTVLQGRPVEEIPALAMRMKASAVFVNHDYGRCTCASAPSRFARWRGRPPPGAMRSPISACSTPSRSRKNSTLTASSSAAIYLNSRRRPGNSSTRPG